MERVGAYEAKTHLSRLLERVGKGERIVITKHGTPVAVLQPFDPAQQVDIRPIIREMHRLRETHDASGYSIREMIDEGRR